MPENDVLLSVGLDTRPALREALALSSKLPTVNLKLNDRSFTQPLGKITSKIGEFDKSLAASNARVIAFGASAGIIYGVQKAMTELVRATINVDKKLKEINVILGASTSSLKSFGNELFNIAKNTGQSFNTVADAAQELARQGLSMEETLKRTRDALILTRQSGMDAVSAVEALTATINSFNDAAIDSTVIINKLANVDAKFAVSSRDLAESIKRVGSSAVDAGVNLDELIAIVTTVQQTTARGGAVIGNALKTIFTRVNNSGTLEELNALGIAIRDINGDVLPTIRILKNLADSYDDLGHAEKSHITQLVGSVYQINILKAALNDLGKAQSVYDRALSVSANSTNEAMIRNEEYNKTLDALIKNTITNFTKLGSQIGSNAIEPALRRVLTGVNVVLEGISDEAEGSGASIGKGLMKGLGNFLSGPGLAIGGYGIYKLVSKFSGDIAGAFKSVLSLNSEVQKQVILQRELNSILDNDTGLRNAILNKTITQVQLEDQLLVKLRERLMVVEKLSGATSLASTNALRSGTVIVDARKEKVSLPRKSAGGLLPEAEEVMGAIRGGYRPGQIKKMNVKGLGDIVYNSAEQVKDFGFEQPAILPPLGSDASRQYRKAFEGRHGFNPYTASTGVVPSSLAIGRSGHYGIFKDLKKTMEGYPLGVKIPKMTSTTADFDNERMIGQLLFGYNDKAARKGMYFPKTWSNDIVQKSFPKLPKGYFKNGIFKEVLSGKSPIDLSNTFKEGSLMHSRIQKFGMRLGQAAGYEIGKFGVQPDDLHGGNYNLNQPGINWLMGHALGNENPFAARMQLDDFARAGGKMSIFDVGMFKKMGAAKGLVPNFALLPRVLSQGNKLGRGAYGTFYDAESIHKRLTGKGVKVVNPLTEGRPLESFHANDLLEEMVNFEIAEKHNLPVAKSYGSLLATFRRGYAAKQTIKGVTAKDFLQETAWDRRPEYRHVDPIEIENLLSSQKERFKDKFQKHDMEAFDFHLGNWMIPNSASEQIKGLLKENPPDFMNAAKILDDKSVIVDLGIIEHSGNSKTKRDLKILNVLEQAKGLKAKNPNMFGFAKSLNPSKFGIDPSRYKSPQLELNFASGLNPVIPNFANKFEREWIKNRLTHGYGDNRESLQEEIKSGRAARRTGDNSFYDQASRRLVGPSAPWIEFPDLTPNRYSSVNYSNQSYNRRPKVEWFPEGNSFTWNPEKNETHIDFLLNREGEMLQNAKAYPQRYPMSPEEKKRLTPKAIHNAKKLDKFFSYTAEKHPRSWIDAHIVGPHVLPFLSRIPDKYGFGIRGTFDKDVFKPELHKVSFKEYLEQIGGTLGSDNIVTFNVPPGPSKKERQEAANSKFIKGRNTFQRTWLNETVKKTGLDISNPDDIIRLGAQFAKQYGENQGLLGFASGLNPLSSAINREISAGVPASSVRVGFDPNLKSPINPGGMGVYNTKDEPLGLRQGVARAVARGLNPKTHGIPNFANDNPYQFKPGSFTPASFQGLLQQEVGKLISQIKSGALTMASFGQELDKLTKAFPLTGQSVQRIKQKMERAYNETAPTIPNSYQAASARANAASSASAAITRQKANQDMQVWYTNQRFAGAIQDYSNRNTPLLSPMGQGMQQYPNPIGPKNQGAFGRTLGSVKGWVGNPNNTMKLGGAAFAAPMLGGMIQEVISSMQTPGADNRKIRGTSALVGGASSVVGLAATGGMVGGPWGAAIGGLVGVGLELGKVINAFSDRLPDLQDNLALVSEATSKTINSLATYIDITQQMDSNFEKLSENQKQKLESKRNLVAAALDPKYQTRLANAKTVEEKIEIQNQIATELNQKRFKAEKMAEADILTKKIKQEKFFTKDLNDYKGSTWLGGGQAGGGYVKNYGYIAQGKSLEQMNAFGSDFVGLENDKGETLQSFYKKHPELVQTLEKSRGTDKFFPTAIRHASRAGNQDAVDVLNHFKEQLKNKPEDQLSFSKNFIKNVVSPEAFKLTEDRQATEKKLRDDTRNSLADFANSVYKSSVELDRLSIVLEKTVALDNQKLGIAEEVTKTENSGALELKSFTRGSMTMAGLKYTEELRSANAAKGIEEGGITGKYRVEKRKTITSKLSSFESSIEPKKEDFDTGKGMTKVNAQKAFQKQIADDGLYVKDFDALKKYASEKMPELEKNRLNIQPGQDYDTINAQLTFFKDLNREISELQERQNMELDIAKQKYEGITQVLGIQLKSTKDVIELQRRLSAGAGAIEFGNPNNRNAENRYLRFMRAKYNPSEAAQSSREELETRAKLGGGISLTEVENQAKKDFAANKYQGSSYNDEGRAYQEIFLRLQEVYKDQINIHDQGNNNLREVVKDEAQLREDAIIKLRESLTKEKQEAINLTGMQREVARREYMEGRGTGAAYREATEGYLESKAQAGELSIKDVGSAFTSQFEHNSADWMKDLKDSAIDLGQTMKSSFKGAFHEFLTGAKSAEDALKGIGITIAEKILERSFNMGIDAIFGAVVNVGRGLYGQYVQGNTPQGRRGGFVNGGDIQAYASGGMVVGGSGVRDDVPAALTDGEFVLRKSAVQKYGPEFLEKLNRGGLVKMAKGGIADVTLKNQYITSREGGRKGKLDVDAQLSTYALTEENNPMNQRRMDLESRYLDYRHERRETMQAFDKAQKQRLQAAWISAALQIAGSAAGAAAGQYASNYAGSAGSAVAQQTTGAALAAIKDVGFAAAGKNSGNGYGGGSSGGYYNPTMTTSKTSSPAGEPISLYDASGRQVTVYGYVERPTFPSLTTPGGGNFDTEHYSNRALGGYVKKFAVGGYAGRDKVPSLLMGGEFVANKDSVGKYGRPFFESLNRGEVNPSNVRKFADGGFVGNDSAAPMMQGFSGGEDNKMLDVLMKMLSLTEEINKNLEENKPKSNTTNKTDRPSDSKGGDVNVSIVVHVANDGKSSSESSSSSSDSEGSESDSTKSQEFAKNLESAVIKVISEQKRPGGLLSK